jgi:two-component system heavy metal sensor histidine kinase CusS
MSSKSAANRPARWSLAARLTAWYGGSAFLLISAATGFLYWALVSNLDRADDQFLVDKIRFLGVLLRNRSDDLPGLRQEVEWEWSTSRYAQFYVRILDETGRAIIESPGMSKYLAPEQFPGAGPVETEPGPGAEIHSTAGKSFRVLAARAGLGPSGGPPRTIQIALDRSYEEDLLAGYRRNLWLVLGVAFGACALAGYQIARRGLRPVAEITAMARRIRSTNLQERIEGASLPGELSLLASTFNEMLDRLEEAFTRLARFTADIAHELRTPVNNLRGEAEVALGKARSPEEYREVLGSCLEECGRLARTIESFLFLARAESPAATIAAEPVDVGRELATARDFYEPAAAEAGVSLHLTAPDGIRTTLDRTLFQRAIGNLVANALAHTRSGGAITLTAARNDGAVHVQVADTGCGIAREHLPFVFDRLYRVDQARSAAAGGVGLGLAIVKSIATLHRGSALIDSRLGEGTCVTLVFPVERPADDAQNLA